jgi:diguanylate cyclase (GGDEF)-like protein
MKDVLIVWDFIARIGVDEFVAVVDGVVDDERATALMQRLIEVVSQPAVTAEGRYQIGASIGIAHARHYPDSVEALVNAADGAMYVTKRSGKGTVRLAGFP